MVLSSHVSIDVNAALTPGLSFAPDRATRHSSSEIHVFYALSQGIILLEDNGRPHTANMTVETLQKCETLQHQPYSRATLVFLKKAQTL